MSTSNGVYDVPNVAMIPPIPDVHWTTPMTFHLCEAPIVLTSEKYAQYYKWHVDKGHYVILDNGAAIGGTVTDKQLIEAAGVIVADEIVVPDEMADKDATLARAKKFLKQWVGPTNTTLMFVPQGEGFIDWAQCLAGLRKIGDFGLRRVVIGLGKHMHARVIGGRRTLVHYCHDQQLTCHLLGASDDPLEDIALLSHPAVRGSDTSLPFVMAQHDYSLQKDPGPDGMWCSPVLEGKRPLLDFLRTSDMLGRINMETYLYWVQNEHRAASTT